jgi:hypothetical protein
VSQVSIVQTLSTLLVLEFQTGVFHISTLSEFEQFAVQIEARPVPELVFPLVQGVQLLTIPGLAEYESAGHAGHVLLSA